MAACGAEDSPLRFSRTCCSSTRARTRFVPLDPPPTIDPNTTYHVVTVKGDKFVAKGLVVDDESIQFKSHSQDYIFPRNEIRSIARLEYDKSRTFLALAVVAAAVTGLILLVGEMVESLGAAASAN